MSKSNANSNTLNSFSQLVGSAFRVLAPLRHEPLGSDGRRQIEDALKSMKGRPKSQLTRGDILQAELYHTLLDLDASPAAAAASLRQLIATATVFLAEKTNVRPAVTAIFDTATTLDLAMVEHVKALEAEVAAFDSKLGAETKMLTDQIMELNARYSAQDEAVIQANKELDAAMEAKTALELSQDRWVMENAELKTKLAAVGQTVAVAAAVTLTPKSADEEAALAMVEEAIAARDSALRTGEDQLALIEEQKQTIARLEKALSEKSAATAPALVSATTGLPIDSNGKLSPIAADCSKQVQAAITDMRQEIHADLKGVIDLLSDVKGALPVGSGTMVRTCIELSLTKLNEIVSD